MFSSALLCLPALLGPAPQPVLAPAPVAGPAARQDEVDLILDDRLEAIRGMDAGGIWREAARVGGLLDEELGAAMDATLDARLRGGVEDPRRLLFMVSLRLDGDDVDHGLIATATATATTVTTATTTAETAFT